MPGFTLKQVVIFLLVLVCFLFSLVVGAILVLQFSSIDDISGSLIDSLHNNTIQHVHYAIEAASRASRALRDTFIAYDLHKATPPYTPLWKPMYACAKRWPHLALFAYAHIDGYLVELRKGHFDGPTNIVDVSNPPTWAREIYLLRQCNESCPFDGTQHTLHYVETQINNTCYSPNATWWTNETQTPALGRSFLYYCKALESINFAYGIPLRGPNGRWLGLSYAEFTLYDLSNVLRSIRRGNDILFIISKRGKLMATSTTERVAGRGVMELHKAVHSKDDVTRDAALVLQSIKEANRTIWDVRMRIRAGKQDFMMSTVAFSVDPYVPQNWTIVLLIPCRDIFSTVDMALVGSVAAIVFVFLLLLVIGVLIVNSISTHMRRIVSQIDGIVHYHDNAFFTSEGDANDSMRRSVVQIQEVEGIEESLKRMKTLLRSFEKYIPAELLRYLIQQKQPAELGLQRANATVMFIDVEGFTALVEHVPSPALIEQFTEYSGEAMRIIAENCGTFDKMMGDGIMAFFGCPPAPMRYHQYYAARCALQLQRAMVRLRAKWSREGRTPFNIRIGIASGPVSVGNVGSTERYQYTVFGESVHLASRMEGLNKHFGTSILLTGHCYEALRDGFIGRRLGTVRVKGRSNRTRVFELVSHAELFSGECAAYRPLTASQEVPATSRTELLDEAPSARTLDDFTSVRSPIMRARTPPEVPTTPQTPQTPLSEIFISTRSQSPRSRGVQPARVPNEPLFKVIIPAEIERLPRVAIQLYEFCTYFSNAVRLYESRQFNDAIRLVRLYLSVNHALMRAEVHRIEQECYNEANVSAKDQYEPDLATMVQTSMVMSHSQRTRIGLPEGQAGNVGDLHTGEGDYAWDLLQRCEKMRSENVDANWDPVLTMTEK
eukprot:gnl/Trimastix_PCT/2535.p1 GENE.gnl/Trimastix_PCT/2535~~gnl/Trimastix_PCT/2535.p1  ORF type:complete len:890 (-),score=238.52 gnl/Trimastix_PCT/2535:151-2820(-)